MIGIIDYGVGNLRSVQKAFELLGHDAAILPGPAALKGVSKLILPGVGAFADGMAYLREREWIDPLKEHVDKGQPLLGICLGLQLMFEGSEEDAPSPDQLVPGLGILPGKVVRFDEAEGGRTGGDRLKVPHMGWNQITWQRDDPLLAGLDQGSAVYFVHSFYAAPAESGAEPVTSATCDYGKVFTATAWRGNVWATQFHPEKSQKVGLKILDNFARI